MKPYKRNAIAPLLSSSASKIVALLLIAFGVMAEAQAQLKVSVMPSHSQSANYGKAAINQAITVWGRTWGGTGAQTYVLDFGDGTATATGSVTNANEISASHTYTTGGLKTFTLTVTDSTATSVSRSGVLRVLTTPTHDDRVAMAIEKGLLYLYRNQLRTTVAGIPVCYWYSSNGGEYTAGASGSTVMSFAENGHLATNNQVDDIYADTVLRGVYYILSQGRAMAISAQTDGNPDTNGNGRGIYYPDQIAYAHGFQTMALLNAYATVADAQAATVPSGLWLGGGTAPATVKDFVTDALDQLYWCQGDSGYKGWHYATTTASSGGGGMDGSTHQWPIIAMLTAKERWGFTLPAWVVNNATSVIISGTASSGTYAGGFGYSGPSNWNNCAKTGGLWSATTLLEKISDRMQMPTLP
jgi:PKD repeat protein